MGNDKTKAGPEQGTEVQRVSTASGSGDALDDARRQTYGAPQRAPEYSAADERLRESDPLKWAQRVTANPESYRRYRDQNWSKEGDYKENGHLEQEAVLRGVKRPGGSHVTVADEMQSRLRKIPGFQDIKVSLIETPPQSTVDRCGHDAFLKLEHNGQTRLVPFDLTSANKEGKANVVRYGTGWLKNDSPPGKEATLSLTEKGLSEMADQLKGIMAERCGGSFPSDPSVLMKKAAIEPPPHFDEMLNSKSLNRMTELAVKYADHLARCGWNDEAKRIREGTDGKGGALSYLSGRQGAVDHATQQDMREASALVREHKDRIEKERDAQRQKDLAERSGHLKERIHQETGVSLEEVANKLKANASLRNDLTKLNAGSMIVYEKHARQMAASKSMEQTKAATGMSLDEVCKLATEKNKQCKSLPPSDPRASKAKQDLLDLQNPDLTVRAPAYDRLAQEYRREKSSAAPVAARMATVPRQETRANQVEVPASAGTAGSLEIPELPELSGSTRPRLAALQQDAAKPSVPANGGEVAAAPAAVLIIPPISGTHGETEPGRGKRAESEAARSSEGSPVGTSETEPERTARVESEAARSSEHESRPAERNGKGHGRGAIGGLSAAVMLYYMAKDEIAVLRRRFGGSEPAQEH